MQSTMGVALTRSVRKWATGVGLASGAAAAAAMLGATVAHADNGTEEINGWTVTPTGGSPDGSVFPPATLSDPSNSLGLGTSPISGGFDSVPATPLSSIGSNEAFATPLTTIGTPDNLSIQDNWLPGLLEASVQTGKDNDVLAFLVPAVGDKEVVDLVNFEAHDAPPLFNPDTTGPVDVGGVQLASPQDGALFNDLFDAVFKGDAADFANATTLFDDLLGIDPSSASTAAELAASASGASGTPDEVIGQAISDLNQGTAVLEAAPTADLSTEWTGYFTNQETSITTLEPFLTQLGSQQEGLSSVDQAFLANADEQLVTAAQNVLTADQGLVAADQAGDLTGNLASNPADLPLIDADFTLVSADFAAIGDTILATVFPDIGTLLP